MSDRDDDLDEVVARERELLDPAVRADSDRVGELLHAEFLEYGASGRSWDRQATIASLATDPGVSGSGTDFRPVRLAEDVVLLTYRVQGTISSLRSSVWVRDAELGWQLRFHQGTRTPDA